MKYDYKDLKKMFDCLEKESQKTDVKVVIEPRTNALECQYQDLSGAETTIRIYPSDVESFAVITKTERL